MIIKDTRVIETMLQVSGRHYGMFTSEQSERSRTVPEDTTLNAGETVRFEVTKVLMADVNTGREINMRQHRDRFLV